MTSPPTCRTSTSIFLFLLRGKLADDLIAQLSELADAKIGRTNFYFASRKFGVLAEEVQQFERYVLKNKLRGKRNQEIAHREQPPELCLYAWIRSQYARANRE